jgi:hypothetical protein
MLQGIQNAVRANPGAQEAMRKMTGGQQPTEADMQRVMDGAPA